VAGQPLPRREPRPAVPPPTGSIVPWQGAPATLTLPAARTGGAALQLGSHLLYIGGSDGQKAATTTYAATVQNGNAGAWGDGPPPTAPPHPSRLPTSGRPARVSSRARRARRRPRAARWRPRPRRPRPHRLRRPLRPARRPARALPRPRRSGSSNGPPATRSS